MGCDLRHRRARPDEWTAAGVFERLAELMLAAPNEMIGLQCDELSLDGSIPNALPSGGRVDGQELQVAAQQTSGWHTVTTGTTPSASMDVAEVQAYS